MGKVMGYGPRDAKIIFIGEAPGREEELAGQPFVGASGKLLNQILAEVGISRDACYFTNVFKERPAGNDFGILYVDKKRNQQSQVLLDSIRSLHHEIAEFDANVIVPLGGEALRALTSRRSIEKWRGSIIDSVVWGKVIPTLHPAYVLRMYSAYPILQLDLRRVAQESTSPECNLPKHTFSINPSYEQVISWLDARIAQPPKRLSFDIETSSRGHEGFTRSIALSDDPLSALCIPLMSNRRGGVALSAGSVLFGSNEHSSEMNSHWEKEEEYEILRRLDAVLGDERIPKVAQNFPFDAYVLAKEFGFDIRYLYMDTMVAHHAAYCELPKGLDFLTSIYTRTPYYSDYDASVDLDLWRYNCFDAACTLEISYRLDEELASLGIDEFYHNHLNPCIPALTRTQNRGVRIDVPLRTTMTETAKRERDELGKKLGELTGLGDFNPRSYKQKIELLYDKMGLPKQYAFKGGERRVTTDKKALEVLIRKKPECASIVRSIIDYQERATLISTFLEKELDSENRIRTSYNLAGTVTGRISSSEPLWDAGTNLANIPIRTEPGKLFRRVFIADEDWSIIKTDLSQAEFRLVVWMSKIHRIIERMSRRDGFDIYRHIAGLIYKKEEKDIVKQERDYGKVAVLGGNYHIMPPKLALQNRLDVQVARFILDSYLALLPEIPATYWAETEKLVNTSRVLTSPLGRRRVFFDRLDDELYRAAYSHRAQCIVGDLIIRALELSVEIFDECECFAIMQVYDELVFMCRTPLVPIYAPRIRNLMEYPLMFDGVSEPLIIPADISHGPNWLDQVKI